MPAVITLVSTLTMNTAEGIPVGKAARKLEVTGADVVGLNCSRGPKTIVECIREVWKECKVWNVITLLMKIMDFTQKKLKTNFLCRKTLPKKICQIIKFVVFQDSSSITCV